MSLKSNRAILIASFFALLLNSCGGPEDYHINEKETIVPVIPKVSIDVKAQKNILYLHNKMQATVESIPFLKNSLKFIEQGTALFTATGDGGLGVDLDSENNLNWYEGIPVLFSWNYVNNNSKKVLISSSGDGNCPHIFTFDQEKKLIRIDYSGVNTLLVCDVKITAMASLNGESIQGEKIFQVALNPTMAFYAKNNDVTYRYLKESTSLNDITLIARWLKDKTTQASGLKFIDVTQAFPIKNMNALTGAQSIKSLDLSYTSLDDLKAISYLKNLENIDLSFTKFESQNISLLKDISSLRSLKIRGIHLKNMNAVTDNLKNLTELDISNNYEIKDLENIQNLKNLNVLKASNVNLRSLNKFNNMIQLTDLDISKNDLSRIDVTDVQTLANLCNLKGLDVSGTHIPDKFLNSYFDFISKRNNLEKFVDINYFDRNFDITEEKCKYSINIFDDIPNIGHVISLKYIDLHGNGCKISGQFKQIGLTNTRFFSEMPNLKYLDISDTPVNNLSGLAYLENLQTLHLVYHSNGENLIDEGGISMTADECLLFFTPGNQLASECGYLPN